jgi:hypothetical protein
MAVHRWGAGVHEAQRRPQFALRHNTNATIAAESNDRRQNRARCLLGDIIEINLPGSDAMTAETGDLGLEPNPRLVIPSALKQQQALLLLFTLSAEEENRRMKGAGNRRHRE